MDIFLCEYMSMKESKYIIADNLKQLMAHGMVTQMQLAERAHVTQSTVSRLLKAEVAPNTDTLDAICKYFGIFPWQMLVPNIQPNNFPVLREINDKERDFYDKIKQAAKLISQGQ